MAYKHTNSKGKEYYLHSRKVGNKGGKLYFFAKEVKEEGAEEQLPEGYDIVENERTGLPTLKKKNKDEKEK